MRRELFTMTFVAMLFPWVGGCMMSQPDARYIYQDGQYGVIGVPRNSPFGLKNYEEQARQLMAKHFPTGYEIVRAEEVVEGQRVLDLNRSRQLETEPTISALDQKIKLGKLAETTSTQQKDSIAITESRIIYKKRTMDGPLGTDGFAAQASLIPEFYLDPNEIMRVHNQVEIAEAKAKEKNAANTAIATQSPGQSDKPVVAEAPKPAPPVAPNPVAVSAKSLDPTVQKASTETKK